MMMSLHSKSSRDCCTCKKTADGRNISWSTTKRMYRLVFFYLTFLTSKSHDYLGMLELTCIAICMWQQLKNIKKNMFGGWKFQLKAAWQAHAQTKHPLPPLLRWPLWPLTDILVAAKRTLPFIKLWWKNKHPLQSALKTRGAEGER